MREEGTPTAFMLEDVERAEAHDERTLEITLKEPRNYFLYTLASAWSFPWPRHKVEELGEDWRLPEHLVSNGPFVLDELTDEAAVLTANPYWSDQRERGNVRELHVTFTAGSPMSADWRTGQYDVLEAFDDDFIFDNQMLCPSCRSATSRSARTSRPSRAQTSARRSRSPSIATGRAPS